MNELSRTLFIPLYYRYLESIKDKEIYDAKAVDFFNGKPIIDGIDYSTIEKDINSFTGTVARTLIIDEKLKKLLKEGKLERVYSVGCGLDYRNRRLGTSIPWYNIDLEPVIEYRKTLGSVVDKEVDVVGDILKVENWDFIEKKKNLFILEGILMYFHEDTVKEVLKKLSRSSKEAYFIIESLPTALITKEMQNPSVKSIGEDISFKWGTDDVVSFAKSVGIELENSSKIVGILEDRWELDGFPKNIIDNFRISLFRG